MRVLVEITLRALSFSDPDTLEAYEGYGLSLSKIILKLTLHAPRDHRKRDCRRDHEKSFAS